VINVESVLGNFKQEQMTGEPEPSDLSTTALFLVSHYFKIFLRSYLCCFPPVPFESIGKRRLSV